MVNQGPHHQFTKRYSGTWQYDIKCSPRIAVNYVELVSALVCCVCNQLESTNQICSHTQQTTFVNRVNVFSLPIQWPKLKLFLVLLKLIIIDSSNFKKLKFINLTWPVQQGFWKKFFCWTILDLKMFIPFLQSEYASGNYYISCTKRL